MKKLYQCEQYKRHSQRIARRKLKRLKKYRRISGFKHAAVGRRRQHHHKIEECIAPANFSIVENPEETLLFFDQVYNYLRQEYSVSLKLEAVNKITPDAILYILSLLDMFKLRQGIKIMGNAPTDEHARQIFLESGFYSHVNSLYSPKRNKDILAIRSEARVIGSIANEVVQFAREKITGGMPPLVCRKVYTTILECMGNTREHAYTGREKYHTKWWLMALYTAATNSVTFSILDNGLTIPSTVKKKVILERVWTADHKLIISALRGEFRTRMNELWRGKGLPKIFKTFEDGNIGDLAIVSNRGYVNFGSNHNRDIRQKFFGTLVSWTIKQEKQND